MTQEEVRKILNVGVLLSSERDLNKLLEHILSSVMELAHCDAGTLYLLDAAGPSARPHEAGKRVRPGPAGGADHPCGGRDMQPGL